MNAKDRVAYTIGHLTIRVTELESELEALREENKKLTNELYPLKEANERQRVPGQNAPD